MREFFPGDSKTELASNVSLFINGRKLIDDDQLGDNMKPNTTGQDLYPNEVIIQIEDSSPPTMTLKERAELAKECEKADFKLPNKDKNNKKSQESSQTSHAFTSSQVGSVGVTMAYLS